MSPTRKRLWLVAKTALAAAIVAAVAWYFYDILRRPEFHPYPFALRVEYLIPAGVLYLLAHCCWSGFWVRLLRSQGAPVSLHVGLRAYFASQFGKYIPGKAWVILMRVAMLRGEPGGKPLTVGVTATYETLTTVAAGALLGAVLLPWVGVLPGAVGRNMTFVVALAGLPLAIGVLNKLAARKVARMRGPDAPPLPSPPLLLLLQGLLQAAVGWCLLGVSLGLTVQAVAPDPPPWTAASFLGDVGTIALAYVSGFVVLVAPGGVGVRELILQTALRPRFADALEPALADGLAVVVALVLRLAWTVPELVFAVGLYLWRPRTTTPAEFPAADAAAAPTARLPQPADGREAPHV